MFFIKITLKERPFLLLVSALTIFVIVFGFLVQLFERGIFLNAGYDSFKIVWNSMWVIILSMTTVGFGDVVPLTNLGRLFTMIACFAGTFVISLMTVTITTKIQMNE